MSFILMKYIFFLYKNCIKYARGVRIYAICIHKSTTEPETIEFQNNNNNNKIYEMHFSLLKRHTIELRFMLKKKMKLKIIKYFMIYNDNDNNNNNVPYRIHVNKCLVYVK